MNIRRWIHTVLSVSFLLGGCANLPTASQLTPDLNKSDYVTSDKTLTVGDITGKEQKDVLGVMTISVGNNVFKDALLNTLKASGIFREVSPNPGGDYLLSAQIISQSLEGYSPTIQTLLVRYRLVESASGKSIWTENIFSEKSLSLTDISSGRERTNKLRQITFGDNLSKLVMDLNKVFSQTRIAQPAATLLSVTTAHAALQSRLNGQVVYDTDLNVTWLANANLAATNTFGVSGILKGSKAGLMSWTTAQKWIAAMNAANYLGYNNWELPTTLQPDASCGTQSSLRGVECLIFGHFRLQPDASCARTSFGVSCTGSMMGHLFYTELGGGVGSSPHHPPQCQL